MRELWKDKGVKRLMNDFLFIMGYIAVFGICLLFIVDFGDYRA